MLRGIVQFDTLNEVNIRLSDGTKAFNYDGYTSIVFKVLKADGTAYIDSEGENVIATSPVDGIVTVYLTGQSTTAAGVCQSVLEIYSGDGKMTTARFNYEVFENLDTNEAIESTTEYPALQNLMTDLSGIKADAAVASGYTARSEAAAETAEMWARAVQDIAKGDFATRAELDAVAEAAAPAGYGLGDINVIVTGNSANAEEAKKIGYYVCNVDTPTNHWWYIHTVSNYGGVAIVQEAYNYRYNRKCRRVFIDGAWDEWEWENPSMETNVEYRTTERFLCAPVYRKVVWTTMPENKVATISALPDGAALLDYDVVVQKRTETTTTRVLPFNSNVSNADKIECWNEGGSIYLKTYAEGWTAYYAYISLKYYKTTDT